MPAVMEAHFKQSVQVDFRLVGRLAPGVTREQAMAELNVVTRRIAEKYKGAVIPDYENEGIFPSDLKVQLRYAVLGQWGAFKSARTLQRAISGDNRGRYFFRSNAIKATSPPTTIIARITRNRLKIQAMPIPSVAHLTHQSPGDVIAL